MNYKRGIAAFALTVMTGILFAVASRTEAKSMKKPSNFRIESHATEKTELSEALKGRQVYFSGIEDMTISKTSIIHLENLPENEDIMMVYEIKEGDKVLKTTEMIPAGMDIEWVSGKVLDAGKHELSFIQHPFYMYQGKYIPLTVTRNEVSIEIGGQ